MRIRQLLYWNFFAHMQHLRDLPAVVRILQILTARYNEARAGLTATATAEQATASSQTAGAQSESGHSGSVRMRATPGPSAIAYAECVHQLITALGMPFLVENASDAHNLAHQSSHALSEIGAPLVYANLLTPFWLWLWQ